VKTNLLYVLLSSALVGCSKNEAPTNAQSSKSSAALEQSLRPKISFVESIETREAKEIGNQAIAFLTNKDFAGLEALAAKYRASKDQNANGVWKLAAVYNRIEPFDEDSDANWEGRVKQVQQWTKARPETAMSRIALARILTSYAWKARGGDWAEKVKDSHWDTFFARLQKALAALQEAKPLKEPCPVYWSSMQEVALGLQFDKKRYNAIFAQAIQEYPDYEYYYISRARYLLPRWYGGEGEWEQDLQKSADRMGGEAGDVLYARVMWCTINSSSPSDVSAIFKQKKSAWERVDKGFDIILKRFPDSLSAKSGRAVLAAMAGEKGKARDYFLETKGEVDLANWDGKKDFEKFFSWTFGR
jgi:hypothetical protein